MAHNGLTEKHSVHTPGINMDIFTIKLIQNQLSCSLSCFCDTTQSCIGIIIHFIIEALLKIDETSASRLKSSLHIILKCSFFFRFHYTYLLTNVQETCARLAAGLSLGLVVSVELI